MTHERCYDYLIEASHVAKRDDELNAYDNAVVDVQLTWLRRLMILLATRGEGGCIIYSFICESCLKCCCQSSITDKPEEVRGNTLPYLSYVYRITISLCAAAKRFAAISQTKLAAGRTILDLDCGRLGP